MLHSSSGYTKNEQTLINLQLVVCPNEVKDKQAWLLQNVRGADGLLCMLSDKVTPEVIEAGTNL